MNNAFSRTELLLGKEVMEKIYNSKIAVFGAGGVGSYAIEALARTGVGSFIIVDNDIISLSNINRQLIATMKTLGKPKAEVIKERLIDINPNVSVITYETFFLPENAYSINLDNCDYIVDAIDTITAKLQLAIIAKEKNIPIIASLGTGNKVDPTKLEIDDISNTSICPLAKVMRKELKRKGIEKLKVVYSKEMPIKVNAINEENFSNKEISLKRSIPGSVSFVPSVAGLIIAGEVIKDIGGFNG